MEHSPLEISIMDALKESEENFKTFFDTIDDIIVVGTPEGKVLYSNKAMSEKLGFSSEELKGMHILDVHPAEHREEAEKIFSEMFKGERDYCPLPLIKKNGTYLPVETRVWFGKWGGQDSIFGVSKDLSKQQAALEKFHKIFDNNPALMVLSSMEDNRIKDVNASFCEVLGYSKSEVIGKTTAELGLFTQPEKKSEITQTLMTEGRIKGVELDVKKKNGEIINGLFSGEIIYNQVEKSFLTVMVDITSSKKAEMLLELSEKMLSAIAFSTKELLVNTNYYAAITKSLVLIGQATGVDRVYLFENAYDQEQEVFFTSQRIEWNSGVEEPQIDNPELQNVPFDEIELFVEPLSRGEAFIATVCELEESKTKELLEFQNILSILVLPIFIGENFWGFVGFDECKFERIWTDTEISLLSSFVNSISKAIERKSLEDELERAKQAAEEANSIKNYFIANMSHEIRTPMNGILGFLHLLEETSVNAEQKKYIDVIKKSSNILLSVINDILDISKIEAEKLVFEMSDFSVRDVIEEVIVLFSEEINKKGLDIRVNIALDIPKVVSGDVLRFKQVIMNLVSNAIKFTEYGEVSIEGKLKAQTLNDVEIELIVRDTGIGISKDKLGKLFMPFTQAHTSSTVNYGGTGLGLYICRQLIKMMNGEIWAESVEDEGSSFYFTVTLNKSNYKEEGSNYKGEAILEGKSKDIKSDNKIKSDNPTKKDEQIKNKSDIVESKKNLEGMGKILLVEDNESNRNLFTSVLKNKGIICDIAQNGEEAIKACIDNFYDLIFMDCQMPLVDGYEATRRIRENEETGKRSVIIAMTAYAMKGDKEKCLAAGMDDYVSKPINFKIIESLIEKYLNKSTGVEPKEEAREYIKNDILEKEGLIKGYFDIFLFETGIQYKDAKELFLDYLNSLGNIINEMEVLVKTEKYDDLAKRSHQLKGSSANFRLEDLYELSKELENAIKKQDFSTCINKISHMKNFIDINLYDIIS